MQQVGRSTVLTSFDAAEGSRVYTLLVWLPSLLSRERQNRRADDEWFLCLLRAGERCNLRGVQIPLSRTEQEQEAERQRG